MRTNDPAGIKAVKRRISSVDELGPYVKVGVFGPNGSGKTRFAASAPNCLIIDINEMGTRSAVGSGAKKIEVTGWEDIGHLYWYLKAGDHPFESVAIDTVTAMHSMAMSFVLEEKEERDPSTVRDQPIQRDWGRAGQLVSSMVWAFRNLDMHVIITAQVRKDKDKDTGEVLDTTVDLPAGCRGSVTGAVSVLGFLEPKEIRVKNPESGKRENIWVDQMWCGPHRDYSVLKDRTNQLGPVLRRPTMSKVIKAWLNTEGQ